MKHAILFYCRPGFEADVEAEFTFKADIPGKWEIGQGFCLFLPKRPADWDKLYRTLECGDWVFPRQIVFVAEALDLPPKDRLTPILNALDGLHETHQGPWRDVWIEYPDTNDGKEISSFSRKFGALLDAKLAAKGRGNQPEASARLHLFFPTLERVYIGFTRPDFSVNWQLGIPRLRMPTDAPSRSTLKLAEAFMMLVPESAQVKPGMSAVDLGAAPGGWTWQMVSRGCTKIFAIDNGPMKGSMAIHPSVKHLREDGFKYRPKSPVDWLVCDMVEQPARIAALMADWMIKGHARQFIFNFKLPMKKRWNELQRCMEIIDDALGGAGIRYQFRARHLYHDREEVTCYLSKIKR